MAKKNKKTENELFSERMWKAPTYLEDLKFGLCDCFRYFPTNVLEKLCFVPAIVISLWLCNKLFN